MKKYYLVKLTKGDKEEYYKMLNANKTLTCYMCNSEIFKNKEIAYKKESIFDVYGVKLEVIEKLDMRRKTYRDVPFFSADVVVTF